MAPEEKVKFMKAAWDAIGSEFGSRHTQYEMFYSGARFVTTGHSYRTFDWGGATAMIDNLLSTYDLEDALGERRLRRGLQGSLAFRCSFNDFDNSEARQTSCCDPPHFIYRTPRHLRSQRLSHHPMPTSVIEHPPRCQPAPSGTRAALCGLWQYGKQDVATKKGFDGQTGRRPQAQRGEKQALVRVRDQA
jgi:hypothetical protein